MSAKKQDNLVPISISVPTAAKMLGISARTVWQLVKDHEISSFRIGSRVLIPYQALTTFIEQRLAAAQEA
ncbi:MAG TPA: helix-turn-helix domain-containing protein [Rectinema sp.]|nr:helix-turn-helix domain-containing protein [Rectinema sp.]